MSSWSSVTYVNRGDLDAVEEAMTELFAREGMHPTPRPPERTELIYAPMQYGRAADNDLWAVALLPGRAGWTVIRTAPFHLFCERAAGADRIRLASLAQRLDCNALIYILHATSQGLLIEASRTGAYTLAGFIENPEPRGPTLGYYDEPYAGDEHCQAYFRLLNPDDITDDNTDDMADDMADDCRRPEVSEESRDVIRALATNPYPEHRDGPTREQISAALADALGGPNAEGGSNVIIVSVLIPNRPLHIPGGRALYYARQ